MSAKKNVIYFGGAFDPIHWGHIVTALAAHVQIGMPVWISPCYQHKLKDGMASAEDRLLMCRRATEGFGDQITVFDYEISHEFLGSTYELMKALEEHPDYNRYRFHVLMGVDCYNDVPNKWHKGSQLLAEHPVIVVNRPPYKIAMPVEPPHRTVDLYWQASSTDLKNHIADGNLETAKRQTPPQVWDVIRSQQLYGWQ